MARSMAALYTSEYGHHSAPSLNSYRLKLLDAKLLVASVPPSGDTVLGAGWDTHLVLVDDALLATS